MFENESILQSTSEKITKLWYRVTVASECEDTEIPQYLDTTVIRLLPLLIKIETRMEVQFAIHEDL